MNDCQQANWLTLVSKTSRPTLYQCTWHHSYHSGPTRNIEINSRKFNNLLVCMKVTQIEKSIGPVGWRLENVLPRQMMFTTFYYFLLALIRLNLIYYLSLPFTTPQPPCFLPRPWAVELSGSKNPALITNARYSPLLAPANVHNNSLHKAATFLLGCTMRLHVLLCFSWACSVSEKKKHNKFAVSIPC